ncbi:MAG: chorismate synthase [Candidatus Thorarchaeota archaeon]
MTFKFGKEFSIQVFGESHGEGVGVIVEGCPAGLPIDKAHIQLELDRRRSGASNLASSRSESDIVDIHSGVFKNKSTGAPIAMSVPNVDVDSSTYEEIKDSPRPGHADYTARVKYKGHHDFRGGGFFSGRITASFVMGGSIAKLLLKAGGIEVLAHVVQIGAVRVTKEVPVQEIRTRVYTNDLRCADEESVPKMRDEIENAKKEGDSVGGIIECRILGTPAGIGEPIFDSVESVISHAMFSIPAVKGIEFGSGFKGAALRGSENNDSPAIEEGRITWFQNNAGGILGGITNGAPVIFRVAFKPTPSISKPQRTIDLEKMEETTIRVRGRHDPCIVPRAVPVVEAMAAIAITDLLRRAR